MDSTQARTGAYVAVERRSFCKYYTRDLERVIYFG